MDLRDWQARNGFTYKTASQALGIARSTYHTYLKRESLPKWLILACKAIDRGIKV